MPFSTSVRWWLSFKTHGGKRSLHLTLCLSDCFIVIISLPCMFLGWWTSEQTSKEYLCCWTRLPPEITLICILSKHQSINAVEVVMDSDSSALKIYLHFLALKTLSLPYLTIPVTHAFRTDRAFNISPGPHEHSMCHHQGFIIYRYSVTSHAW